MVRRGGRWAPAASALLLLGLSGGCDHQAADHRPARNLAVNPACDPTRMTCVVRHGALLLSLELLPPVRALHSIPARVEVQGAEARSVTVEFSMPSMDMGRNRYGLVRQGSGLWAGDIILPVCTSGLHDWVAKVEVETPRERLSAKFPFQVEP
jgi:hypothetical protein